MSSWLSLVPGNLPWRCFHVEATADTLARALDGLPLAPLALCPAEPGTSAAARVYRDAVAAEAARRGENHFGPYVSLRLVGGAIEIELFGEPESFARELAVVTRLLARLFEASAPSSWTAFSHELGSGQTGELRTGDAAALAGLLG